MLLHVQGVFRCVIIQTLESKISQNIVEIMHNMCNVYNPQITCDEGGGAGSVQCWIACEA